MASVNTQAERVEARVGILSVNPAFLAEIKELNRELWMVLERLRYFSVRPISMCSQCHELIDMLVKFRELVAMQFSLEETYGYSENSGVVETGFSERAEALRNEHHRLFVSINRICQAGEEMWRDQRLASLTTIIPIAFDEFYAELLDHERRERELLSDVWIKDLGTGD